MQHTILTLANGIRVVHQPATESGITHCCLVIDTGSRDEPQDKIGLAHFMEHVLFKGTTKRNTYRILNRLEVVGGDLNAYTTKEQTCIHASFLNEHLERAVDLITDIVFHSTFPQNEIEKEKGVILDEIDSYKDSPEDQIVDDFDEQIFQNHPLGNNILGTPESVKSFSKKDIASFAKNNYATDKIVFGVYGNISQKKLHRIAEKYLGTIPPNYGNKDRFPVNGYHPSEKVVSKNSFQAHCMLGGRAYPLGHNQKLGMFLLNNILGGPGMSSRLNLEVREKHGICYTIESNYNPFSDTGIFSVYLGTEAEKVDKSVKLVWKELKKLREQRLSTTLLHQAKQRFKGMIALAEESRISVIIAMSKSLLDYGKIDTLPEIFRKIDALESNDLQEISNQIFTKENLSTLIFKPE